MVNQSELIIRRMESLKLLMLADTIDRLPSGNEWQSAYLVAGRRFAHEHYYQRTGKAVQKNYEF